MSEPAMTPRTGDYLSDREQGRLACSCGCPFVEHTEYGCKAHGMHEFRRAYAKRKAELRDLIAAARREAALREEVMEEVVARTEALVIVAERWFKRRGREGPGEEGWREILNETMALLSEVPQ